MKRAILAVDCAFAAAFFASRVYLIWQFWVNTESTMECHRCRHIGGYEPLASWEREHFGYQ
jgi:hypothetical protein